MSLMWKASGTGGTSRRGRARRLLNVAGVLSGQSDCVVCGSPGLGEEALRAATACSAAARSCALRLSRSRGLAASNAANCGASERTSVSTSLGGSGRSARLSYPLLECGWHGAGARRDARAQAGKGVVRGRVDGGGEGAVRIRRGQGAQHRCVGDRRVGGAVQRRRHCPPRRDGLVHVQEQEAGGPRRRRLGRALPAEPQGVQRARLGIQQQVERVGERGLERDGRRRGLGRRLGGTEGYCGRERGSVSVRPGVCRGRRFVTHMATNGVVCRGSRSVSGVARPVRTRWL